MERLRFMEAGGEARTRVECYLLPPKFKIDKDRHRIVTLTFSVKMKADLARVCDQKIQRAWEDCETLDREIESVSLRSEVQNTNLECYELPDSKGTFFVLENRTLGGLYVERNDGQTYLYFSFDAFLSTINLGKWALERYGTSMFIEFRRSQHAMPLKVDAGEVAAAVVSLNESLAKDGTTATLIMDGQTIATFGEAKPSKKTKGKGQA